MNPNTGLDIAGLEAAYDQLAMAIDAAGPEKSELFLVKLALLAAMGYTAEQHPVPAADVALAYAKSVEGLQTGQTYHVGYVG